MATNRFQGVLSTHRDIADLQNYGAYAATLNSVAFNAPLLINGTGSAVLAANNSSTAAIGAYIATANCTVQKLVLHVELGTFTGAAAMDSALWLGGAAALTNGITFQVRDSDDTVLLSTGAAKTIEGFSIDMGATFQRISGQIVDATAGDNSDAVIVDFKPVDVFGAPIRLRVGDKIGFKLNDNFSSGYVISGTVFGRYIYLDT